MRLTLSALLLTALLTAPAAQAQQRAPFPRPTGSAAILDPCLLYTSPSPRDRS